MNVQAEARPAVRAVQKQKVFDCDIHPVMRKPSDVKKYLPRRWQQHFDDYGSSFRMPFAGGDIYPRAAPHLSRRDAVPPNGGPPGCDLAFMQEQHLIPHNIEYGVLQVLAGNNSQRNQDYGAAFTTAMNDWQIEEWLDKDSRFRGSILTTPEDPVSAVAEIERRAADPRFVQVSFQQRNQEPNGRRRFWPLLEAAAHHDLVVGIHTGGYNGHAPVAGGGWPSYYAEQHHLIASAMPAIVTSLIMEGVFERLPKLRVLLVEGGFNWVPTLGWRLDKLWQRLRSEVPHVKRPPSEYIRENFWFTSQPMDETEKPEHLRQLIDWLGWDRLCFASDYPHWDYDDTRYAFPIPMTEAEKSAIFRDNAARLFRVN